MIRAQKVLVGGRNTLRRWMDNIKLQLVPVLNEGPHREQSKIGCRTRLHFKRREILLLHRGDEPGFRDGKISSVNQLRFCFAVTQQPNSRLGRLFVEVYSLHTLRYLHTAWRNPLNSDNSSQRPLLPQRTTNARQRDSNSWSQQSSGCTFTPAQPLGSAVRCNRVE